MKKFQLPRWHGLYAFLLPCLLVCAIFAAAGITPFGDQTLLYGDSNGYYINYMTYARTIYDGTHGLLYSFSKGAGGSLVGLEWGWLLTPYTWMLCLVGWDFIPEAFTAAILLMTSLCGLTMCLLLEDALGKRYSNLLFSTTYALMGFNIVNNYNINFLVGPLMLPLVVLGIQWIVRGKSPLLYILALAYPIVTDVQMGFINCIASFLVFTAMFLADYRQWQSRKMKLWISYGLASLTGGLLPAAVWLPNILSMIGGRASQTELSDFSFVEEAPFLDIGARLFTGASSISQLISGLPVIFCGILPVALTVLYFMNGRIDRRRKSAAGILLGLLLLSFYIRTFTTIFHGMTHTNWFNYRYSFIFSFLLILLAAEEMEYMDLIAIKDILRCGAVMLIVALVIFAKQYEFVSGGSVVFDFLLLAAMGAGFWFYRTKPERADRKSVILLFAICTFLQLYLNGYISEKSVLKDWGQTRDEFQAEIDKREPLIEGVRMADTDFYRMEEENPRTKNDPMLFDFNGLSQGSHNERMFVLQNMGKLGVSFDGGMWNWYDSGVTASMDSLLGLRYVLSERDLQGEKNYIHKLTGMDGTAIFQNPYALSIAILSDDGIADVSMEEETDVFAVQNQIWKAMTGKNADLFTEETDIIFSNHNPLDTYALTSGEIAEMPDPQNTAVSGDSSKEDSDDHTDGRQDGKDDNTYKSYIDYSFTAKQTGPIYLYDSAAVVKERGSSEDILQYVGSFQKGDKVEGKLYLDYGITEELMVATVKGLHICYADMDRLAEYSALLQRRAVSIQKDSDSHLSGDVDAESGQKLLFTIPYDEGWSLYVDGQETELEKTADLFISAEIEPGEHHYELTFFPVGLKAGLVISLLAVMGVILVNIFLKRK